MKEIWSQEMPCIACVCISFISSLLLRHLPADISCFVCATILHSSQHLTFLQHSSNSQHWPSCHTVPARNTNFHATQFQLPWSNVGPAMPVCECVCTLEWKSVGIHQFQSTLTPPAAYVGLALNVNRPIYSQKPNLHLTNLKAPRKWNNGYNKNSTLQGWCIQHL